MSLSPFDMVVAARMSVYRRLPYFMRMLYKLAPVEHRGIGTFFVDERLRMHYDPDVVDKLVRTLGEKIAVEFLATFLGHEVQHPLREHFTRGKAWCADNASRWEALREALAQIHPLLGASIDTMWNVLGDMEINPSLDEAQFKFPPEWKVFYPKTLDLPSGKLAEELGDLLFERAEKIRRGDATAQHVGSDRSKDRKDRQPGRGSRASGGDAGDPGDGAAEGTPGDGADDASGTPGGSPAHANCGGCSGHRHELEDGLDESTAPRGVAPAEVEIARRQVAHDTLEPTEEMKYLMGRFGIGTVPGSLRGWAHAQLAPAIVPWQKVLAPLVSRAVTFARGRVDWKYGRPSRRREVMKQFVGDSAPILPTLRAPVPDVGIVVDTSGSMGAQGSSGRTLLDEALSEVVGIVLATGCPTWAAPVDAAVHDWTLVRSKKDSDKLFQGGGGTDMRVGIAAAEKEGFDVIVLVTDGLTPFPTPEEIPRRARLVTCIVGDAKVPDHMKPVVHVQTGGRK